MKIVTVFKQIIAAIIISATSFAAIASTDIVSSSRSDERTYKSEMALPNNQINEVHFLTRKNPVQKSLSPAGEQLVQISMQCGFAPFPPLGCKVGACVCSSNGTNCQWQIIC